MISVELLYRTHGHCKQSELKLTDESKLIVWCWLIQHKYKLSIQFILSCMNCEKSRIKFNTIIIFCLCQYDKGVCVCMSVCTGRKYNKQDDELATISNLFQSTTLLMAVQVWLTCGWPHYDHRRGNSLIKLQLGPMKSVIKFMIMKHKSETTSAFSSLKRLFGKSIHERLQKASQIPKFFPA